MFYMSLSFNSHMDGINRYNSHKWQFFLDYLYFKSAKEYWGQTFKNHYFEAKSPCSFSGYLCQTYAVACIQWGFPFQNHHFEILYSQDNDVMTQAPLNPPLELSVCQLLGFPEDLFLWFLSLSLVFWFIMSDLHW